MANKIPKTYKFSETIIRLIDELSKSPEFGNATRVIEILVWREAQARDMIQPDNGKDDPGKKKAKRAG
jgi:hypothetical protein